MITYRITAKSSNAATYLNKDDGFVTMFSEVESYGLETATESLLTILEDLITEVSNLKLSTNSGVSIEVINKPQLLAIKNRLPDLLH